MEADNITMTQVQWAEACAAGVRLTSRILTLMQGEPVIVQALALFSLFRSMTPRIRCAYKVVCELNESDHATRANHQAEATEGV